MKSSSVDDMGQGRGERLRTADFGLDRRTPPATRKFVVLFATPLQQYCRFGCGGEGVRSGNHRLQSAIQNPQSQSDSFAFIPPNCILATRPKLTGDQFMRACVQRVSRASVTVAGEE